MCILCVSFQQKTHCCPKCWTWLNYCHNTIEQCDALAHWICGRNSTVYLTSVLLWKNKKIVTPITFLRCKILPYTESILFTRLIVLQMNIQYFVIIAIRPHEHRPLCFLNALLFSRRHVWSHPSPSSVQLIICSLHWGRPEVGANMCSS